MDYRLISLCKRSARLRVLALALTLACAAAAAEASTAPQNTPSPLAPPAVVQQSLPGATLWGQGQLRFLGLRIYDARLWASPQFDAADFGAHALALELTYHRAFTGAAIAQRSITEIERSGALPPAQAQSWQQALNNVLPDVQPGERLTGVYLPGRGMRLWRGEQALPAVDDPELARRFFGIWLSARTSEPALRSALLARQPGSGP